MRIISAYYLRANHEIIKVKSKFLDLISIVTQVLVRIHFIVYSLVTVLFITPIASLLVALVLVGYIVDRVTVFVIQLEEFKNALVEPVSPRHGFG